MSKVMMSLAPFVFVFSAGFVFSACGKGEIPQASTGTEQGTKGVALQKASNEPLTLNGAGATFPYPIYSKWAFEYNRVSGTKLNYQSIGSGGGIAQIKAKTVDFGASDAPLKPADLDAVGLIQFPMIMGGVVPVVNLEGVEPGVLKLEGKVLADIFLGVIKKWNEKPIADLNPGVDLPDAEIAVLHRADGSGTTWIFTNYLDKVSNDWHEKVGMGKAVDWPTGMGGKGNEGVAAYVQRVKGSIGYVEFAYALQNKMSHVQLKNKEGIFVQPTARAFQAAAANADWAGAPAFYLVLTDQPGAQTWPITGASFILMYKESENMAVAKEALKFFSWCYEHGGKEAETLHYVPIPKPVVSMVKKLWKENLKAADSAVLQ